LDFEQKIKYFEEQPLALSYFQEGKRYTYTPDFHIVWQQRNALAECKPAKYANSEENSVKFKAALEWCAEHDWDFCLVFDSDFRSGYYLANIRFLMRYAYYVVRPEVRGRVIDLLSVAPTTVLQLAQRIAPNNLEAAIACLWHMAYCHEIALPMYAEPLSFSSVISLPIPTMPEVKYERLAHLPWFTLPLRGK
jgi:hypothetical protein